MPYVPTDRSELITPPTVEPLTLDQVKLRAGQTWAPGDERDALLQDYIVAARSRVERDTGLALLTQTRDAYAAPPSWSSAYWDYWAVEGVQLGSVCLPLQSVTTVSVGADVVDPTGYQVDRARGRIVLSAPWAPAWGSVAPGLVVRLVAGWPTPVALAAAAPSLVQAVGLLAVHYFTVGRDMVNVGHIIAEVPYGYDELLMPYRQVSLQ